MLSLLLFLVPVIVLSENSNCPCLTTDGGALDVYRTEGQLYYNSYLYPNNYGTDGCKAYDTDPEPLDPFCGNSSGVYSDAPAWCFDSFCYVDPDNCNYRATLSGVFPNSGMHYSYETCGDQSTFEDWFGVNGTGSSSYDLDDLADVVEDYIKSLRRDIEGTYVDMGEHLTSSCPYSDTGCPCNDCVFTSGWGMAVDFDATMLVPHASTAVTDRTSCLYQPIHSFFMKIAGAEYHDTSNFANLYGGFQEDGALTMYPEFDWCPTEYDPRFRPWYSTATTNPKEIIVVIDVSGSMGAEGRIDLARDAALAILDTLTWNDDIGFILFNSVVRDTYPVTACTDTNRELMRQWIMDEVVHGGGTNFVLPMEEAFNMIETSSSNACTKAILFLTDGVADFGADDFAYVEEKAEANDVVIFTYALGAGADKEITKQLACDNDGIFYSVADGADLSEVMSSYYAYFAASISYIGARWILYNDYATNTELLTACTPMYDYSDTASEIAHLIGVVCMDMNIIVDVTTLKSHPDWDDLYARVLETSEQCSVAWDGLSEYDLSVTLEELRSRSAANGAEVCNNVASPDGEGESSSSSSSQLMVVIVIAACASMALIGFVIAWRRTMKLRAQKKAKKQSQASALDTMTSTAKPMPQAVVDPVYVQANTHHQYTQQMPPPPPAYGQQYEMTPVLPNVSPGYEYDRVLQQSAPPAPSPSYQYNQAQHQQTYQYVSHQKM